MNKITIWIYNQFYNFKDWIHSRYMKYKYSDWEDNEYNCGEIKFIWGIKSYDDLSEADACLYTMNDIDICYDRKEKVYILGVETAYLFEDKKAEVEYLERLLDKFTEFMEQNRYETHSSYCLFMSDLCTNCKAATIGELYTMFRIFVEGYKEMYGGTDKWIKNNVL